MANALSNNEDEDNDMDIDGWVPSNASVLKWDASFSLGHFSALFSVTSILYNFMLKLKFKLF